MQIISQSHGIPEFLVGKEAALMGRTTFEPALSAGRDRLLVRVTGR